MDKAGTYIVKSSNYFFLITVSLKDGMYNIKTIGIPSEISVDSGEVLRQSGLECVEIIVTINEDGSGFEEPAELEFLTHGASCGFSPVWTSGKESDVILLKNGEGTVELLRANMSFVSKEFGIQRFSLFDESEFVCPGIELGRIALSLHSTLIHKATWYTRHFGAKPSETGSNQEIYQTNMLLDEKFNTTELENLLGGFGEGTKQMFIDFEREGLSWTQAFGVINKRIGCLFFSGDVLDILSEKFLITDKSPWIIQVTDGPDVIVKYEKIQ